MPPLLTATHLVRWADERRAQDMLPLLIRRLIVASANPIRIDFPAGDSVNRMGYDGFLQTVGGTAFVSAGQSVWELGVGQNPAQKAELDYTTRTAAPVSVTPAETAFVFVTPRRWQGKTAWAQSKQAENVWAEVRAYDADDLEQWLDQTHPVAAWGRRHIAGAPEGLRDVEEVWELWSLRTSPPLSLGLFLAGRDTAAERVRAWLAGPASCLRIRSASADEAIGFLAAVVEALGEPERERVRSRSVLVLTPDAWRAVAGQATPVILLATCPALGSDAQAVARGHHVLLAYGNDAAGVAVDVELPHLRRQPLEDALRGMGVPDERARDLAVESRGRIAALVDLLGGGTAAPHWAGPALAPQLVPLLLAGSWSQTEGDAEAMRRLTRLDGDGFSSLLSRWVNETDPPIRLVGGMWEWVARQRAWPHLGRYISPADLAAFRQVVTDVLGERDPRLDLPADERWMAGIRNCAPRYSEPLRRGLAEGLALLATRPTSVHQHADPVGLVRGVVRDIFGSSPAPGRWYSLAPVLQILAEAAPDEFLTAVERDVIGDVGVRTAIFEEEGMFGGSRHPELLWALETLAWCPEYLTRVAVVLAGLTALDPGGRLANRPHASLRTIFLGWLPHTMANVAQRLAAIDAIHCRYPVVAFDLCVRLMPQPFDTANPTPRPRWRDWNVDPERRATNEQYRAAVEGAFDRALAWAGEDPGRWGRLLSPIPAVAPERVAALLARLEALPLETLADQPGPDLRRAIRRLLHQRRTIEGVYPQLSPEHVARLEAIYARLQPRDLVRRHAWLFDNQPDLLTVTGQDWEQESAAAAAERAAAIREMVEAEGWRSVLRLAAVAEAPAAVGLHVGQSSLPDEDTLELICACLLGEAPLHGCLHGIIAGRFHREGWAWVERVFAADGPRGWAPEGKARFALALPSASATWDWVERWGEEVASEYWRTVSPYGLTNAAQDAPRAIRTLLDRGRPFAAFDLTNLCINTHRAALAPELLLAVLRAITAAATGELDTADTPRADGGTGWHIGELLTAVEEAGAADEAELARAEWVWLPALDHTRRGLRTLNRALSRDPSFFATVVGFIFRPRPPAGEEEPPPPDDAARRRAEMAWRLLNEWRGVPGRTDAGGIDEAALRAWVKGARDALRASGHAKVGDQQIGEVLARVPAGADGAWPHESLRTLLEELDSDDIETGLYIGVVNGRGSTCRSLDAGGEQERQLAERYEGWASAVAASAPRTARVLRALAAGYRSDARREDAERDLNEYRR
jgi:hypothetical protein